MRAACPTCKKIAIFKLYFDIYQEKDSGNIDVLSSCNDCNKGRWIELCAEEYNNLKKQEEDRRKGR